MIRRAFGHALAGPQVERHACPTPVVDLAPERDERLRLRVRPHAGFVEVAVVLTAHDLRRFDRRERTEHLVLLLADRARLERGRRFHRHERQHLEQVVDDHVAVRARLLVEADAMTDRQRLRHVDLHVRDVMAVPDRFEEPVRETEGEDVERRFLPEEVVDAEDLTLVERLVQRRVELHRAREVGTERLLHDDAGPIGEAHLAEAAHDLGRGRGRDAEVVQPGDVAAELVFQLGDDLGQRFVSGRLAHVGEAAPRTSPSRRRARRGARTRRARARVSNGSSRRRGRRATCRRCGTRAAAPPARGGRARAAACGGRDRRSRRTAP